MNGSSAATEFGVKYIYVLVYMVATQAVYSQPSQRRVSGHNRPASLAGQ